MLTFELTVRHDFAGYGRGDAITDEATITEILAGENASRVIKVAAGTHAAAAPQGDPKDPASDADRAQA